MAAELRKCSSYTYLLLAMKLHYFHKYTAGKISIERVTICLKEYIYKGALDMKCSPGVGNNQSNPYITKKMIQ